MSISENLQHIHKMIGDECAFAGRKIDDVQLIAVSKTFDGDAIKPVLEAGQRVFGENRVQEASGKWFDLKEQYSDVQLHLIGPLQTNKVNDALKLFDFIHTVDRPSLAQALAKKLPDCGREIRLTIQVNTGEEPQKSGVIPSELPEFISYCTEDLKLPIEGLMCIPPFAEEPAPHFALLQKLADRYGLKTLSMGMSADFTTAVRFGATHVRVGSAIFGSRA